MLRSLFVLCVLIPSVVQGNFCRDLFSQQNYRRRNLTQVYIHRNSQFPLHPDLIEFSMASDIVLNKISVVSTIDYDRIALSLNNLHSRYGVPVRVALPDYRIPENVRVIPMRLVEDIVQDILHTVYSDLQGWGVDIYQLSDREELFWKSVHDFFDQQQVINLARDYRNGLVANQSDPRVIFDLKNNLLEGLRSSFVSYMDEVMPGGLNSDEYTFLSQSHIF